MCCRERKYTQMHRVEDDFPIWLKLMSIILRYKRMYTSEVIFTEKEYAQEIVGQGASWGHLL